MDTELRATIKRNVEMALAEDIGSGDITAQLIAADKQAHAQVITRGYGILCGTDWVNEVFTSLSEKIDIEWAFKDGSEINSNDVLFSLEGPARAILTGERSALNFLQTLSGTATTSHHYASMVAHTRVKILDTRKTLPGLRLAQKYAVKCGGCYNHRIGLYDAFLIKENHITASGSINAAINSAKEMMPPKQVEIEVESMQELEQALVAEADIIMLDNFSIGMLKEAVLINKGQAKLEASGGINLDTLVPIAETGIDHISIGALTKNCQSIDLSMRIDLENS